MAARAPLWCALALAAGLAVSAAAAPAARPAPPAPPPTAAPLVGFTVHWDFATTPAELERLLAFALDHGARILNVVPPPHVWEQPESLALLRRVFATARQRGVAIVLNRIDGSAFAAATEERTSWLFTHVLTEPARLPSGQATPSFFLATVGNPALEAWQREETRFYAEQFSAEPNLLAFAVGGFNEPFVSQRGSLLCWDDGTDSYELAQYTPYGAAVWQRFLAHNFRTVARVNRAYGTAFPSLAAVPMPGNESDPRFGRPARAYWDLLTAVNDWFVAQLEECRRIWHQHRRRPVPFVLQFNGGLPEKFEKGRPAFAALDIFDWMRRADALGLSLYLNCGYPDWGRASAGAMISFLRLGPLEGKPVLVLEGGNECDGATLEPDGLEFFATAARLLAPSNLIYEFLKEGYADSFSIASGKLIGADGQERTQALAAVAAAFTRARQPVPPVTATYVLDDVATLATDPALQAERRELVRLALRSPVVFLPAADIARLPRGSTLVVQGDSTRRRLEVRLAGSGVTVVPPSAALTPGR